MALKGIKVVELVGLAPAPFCGLILRDFGATVIRVDKMQETIMDCLKRGKKSVALELKSPEGQSIFKKLCSKSDVLIEPFRPGVMERLGLGPSELMKVNKGLIYARLSGFGQSGPLADQAGHDLNYMALSGILSLLSQKGQAPVAPLNLMGDFAGGGLLCALGICMALLERSNSKEGQVIDANIVEGINYVSSWLYHSRKHEQPVSQILWPKPSVRGENTLDGGAPFYTVYKTKDGKFMSVAALEPQFFARFAATLNLEFSQFDAEEFPAMKQRIEEVFLQKTQAEWFDVFRNANCCVVPVIDVENAPEYDHHKERGSYLDDGTPRPAPLLSRTPAEPSLKEPTFSEHSVEILKELGYSEEDVAEFSRKKVVHIPRESKL